MNSLIGRPMLLSGTELSDILNIPPEAVEARRAQRLENTWSVKKRGSVALMNISGPISRYDSFLNWLRGGVAIEDMATDFTAAMENPEIKAVVLDINSPGGEVAGVHEFAEMVHNAKKPVIAYVGGHAASAAYWIATAASEIVCDTTAELGSLGVVFGYRKGSDGIIEIVSSVSPKKRLDPATKEGREDIQGRADDLADIFVGQVAKYRRTTEEKVKSDFGQGSMMIADKAIKSGMADKIGSLEGIISELQAKHTGVNNMGFKTELRALIAGKEDPEIEAAFASLGFFPKAEAPAVDVDKIKAEALEAGKAEGIETGKASVMENIKAVMEKCELAGVTSAKFTSELLSLSPDEAGKKIIDAKADESMQAQIFSTVNPMHDGGENPLLADAKKRAEVKK